MSDSTKIKIATLASQASKPGGDFINVKSFFEGRNLVIATKHQKESVIAPLFVSAFEVKPLLPENFDTDQFGTFSGEVERSASAYETVRMKIKRALDLTGETLAIASEGSFGPHPQIGLIPAGEEIVMLMDTVNDFEISASKISTSTNYAQQQCTLWDEVRKFAIDAGFPSHGLILKNDEKLVKGITSWADLEHAYHQLKREFSALSVETEMRAMYNPTRMKAIKKVTELLIEKINCACPTCGFPGFSIVDRVAGLPCNGCGRPSNFSLKHIYQCQHCGHGQEKLFPEGPASDPMYCDYCNP
jgi:hypothetical protein